MESKDIPAAALALLLGLLLLEILRRLLRKQRNPLVLLLGASGAGKTTLFHQLRDGSSHHGTVPSMAQNSDTVRLPRKDGKDLEVDLVDIPGHPRVRGEAISYYKRADMILFLVDAVDFMAQKSSLSEHLFEVISDLSVQKQRLPLMIVCNKSDQVAKAHSVDFIRKRLEKEVEAVRCTRATLEDGAAQGVSIAKPGEAFTFGGLKRIPVTLGSASALTGDIGEIKAFLL